MDHLIVVLLTVLLSSLPRAVMVEDETKRRTDRRPSVEVEAGSKDFRVLQFFFTQIPAKTGMHICTSMPMRSCDQFHLVLQMEFCEQDGGSSYSAGKKPQKFPVFLRFSSLESRKSLLNEERAGRVSYWAFSYVWDIFQIHTFDRESPY